MHIQEAIKTVVQGRDLGQDDAAAVMQQIMTGEATPAQIAAFLTALHLKGETDAEIAGMAEVMREKAVRVYHDSPVLDTCGTGGDSSNTFNISTTAAFVAAGAGATVAKHGNRAMTSKCGSADVLEALGVNIELDAEGVAQCLDQAGIGFMFAQKFHPAMRYVGPIRREIGIRTAFNVLGPLTNPAHAEYQVLGVASAPLAEKLARALSRMGTQHALVVHGSDGVDELSISASSLVWEVRAGKQPQQHEIVPEKIGIERAPRSAIMGGSIDENVRIVRGILDGSVHGPPRDIVLLNAAAALVAAEQAGDFAEGIMLARKALDEGSAHERMEQMVRVSREAS
jgi:anthranilate phosphoribosyltransferase